MAISIVGVPEVAPSVVTITVHITLSGEELPPEASRLLSDLEALAASQARQQIAGQATQPIAGAAAQIQRTTPLQRTPGAQPPARALRLVETGLVETGLVETGLVETAGDERAEADNYLKVKRIGRATADAPSLYLCTGSRLVLRDGAPVPLTRREYDLFHFLCENPRRVFSRAQLLRQVWGYDMVGTERTVDVHVRRLRVKLGEAARIIATVRGVGYRLDDDAAVQVVVRED